MDNLSTVDKLPGPNVSFIKRFPCSYIATCNKDHLYTKTTCPKCPLLYYPQCQLYYTTTPLYRDHLSTVATYFWSLGWSLYTGFTVVATYFWSLGWSLYTGFTVVATYFWSLGWSLYTGFTVVATYFWSLGWSLYTGFTVVATYFWSLGWSLYTGFTV